MTRRRKRNRHCDPDPDPNPNLIARRVPPKGPTQLLQEHGEGALLGGFLTVQGDVDLGWLGVRVSIMIKRDG